MRLFCFMNNWTGWQVMAWLRQRGADVVGLALHPPARRRFGDEILAAAGLPAERIFDGSALGDPAIAAAVRTLAPDIGVSVLFGYTVSHDILAMFPSGVVNLHPSYLPYGRGAYPNVWSIVERLPAGVTLHYMDAGIDTGDIIAQRHVAVEAVDTGETLYRKLERAALDLFRDVWPFIVDGCAPRKPQDHAQATDHRRRDVDAIDAIDLDRSYIARDLIDLMRARTFPPHRGAYITVDGRRIYLRLSLDYGEEDRR